MSLSEKAWQQINDEWHPWVPEDPTSDPSPAQSRVRAALRALQQQRLPIAAIDQIAELIHAVTVHTLETHFCEECGTRCDGVTACEECGTACDTATLDACTGKCEDCQLAEEED